MKYKKSLLLITSFSFLLSIKTLAQQPDSAKSHNTSCFFVDVTAGPYLFIDHIPYNSVFMIGTRFGYEFKPQIGVLLEYLVGQQEDDQNDLGMTHHVSLQMIWFVLPNDKKIRPYIYAGGGFLEFKDFTKDIYGMGYYGGVGIESRLKNNIAAYVEPRYLNLSNFKFGAANEIAILWGVRVSF